MKFRVLFLLFSTLLTENSKYKFSSDERDNPQRFKLLLVPVNIRENIVNDKIKVFWANNRIEISPKEAIESTVNTYNVTGQKIAPFAMHNQKSTSFQVDNFRDFAVASILGNNFITTKKIILQ